MVTCGAANGEDIATRDRHLDDQDAGHATAWRRCKDAVQARLGPTRHCHITDFIGQDGGTVPYASPQSAEWEYAGGFRLSANE